MVLISFARAGTQRRRDPATRRARSARGSRPAVASSGLIYSRGFRRDARFARVRWADFQRSWACPAVAGVAGRGAHTRNRRRINGRREELGIRWRENKDARRSFFPAVS